MNRRSWLMLPAVAAAFAVSSALAQAPATSPAQAPAGSSGQCKDGTYTNAAKKDGACRGHKGIQTWYAAASSPAGASTPSAPSKPTAPTSSMAPTAAAPAAPAAQPAAPARSSVAANSAPAARTSPAVAASSRPQAPGGGPGLVWVNTSTKVYHCSGSEFYGKTKDGKYMSEADAKAAGAHADHNKACSQ